MRRQQNKRDEEAKTDNEVEEEEQKEPDAQLNAVSEIFNMVVADITRAEPTSAVAQEDEKSQ